MHEIHGSTGARVHGSNFLQIFATFCTFYNTLQLLAPGTMGDGKKVLFNDWINSYAIDQPRDQGARGLRGQGTKGQGTQGTRDGMHFLFYDWINSYAIHQTRNQGRYEACSFQ